jgi:hypothetical protein
MPSSSNDAAVCSSTPTPPLALTEVVGFDHKDTVTPQGSARKDRDGARESAPSAAAVDMNVGGATGGSSDRRPCNLASSSPTTKRSLLEPSSHRCVGPEESVKRLDERSFRRRRTSSRSLAQRQQRAQFLKRQGSKYMSTLGQMRSKIAEMDRQRLYVLNPNRNKWIGTWDIFSTMALLYTASLTPVETAFVATVVGPACWQDGWFLTNRLLDFIFFVDMLLQV